MPRGQKTEVGDTRWSQNGYHYTRYEDGWDITARRVLAKHLGREKLASNERVRYKDGNSKNYADPSNLELVVSTATPLKKQLARLYARRDELNGQIADLEAAIAKHESASS
jgi:hypothetical protein